MTEEERVTTYLAFLKMYIDQKKEVDHFLVPMTTFEHLHKEAIKLHEENVKLKQERIGQE